MFDFDIALIPSPDGATHSVQVLRTYPIATNLLREEFDPSSEPVNIGYSWSDHGEFTVWGAYLETIKGATKYIYIEDQYFNSFNVPPAFEEDPGSLLRENDLVYQLGKRIEDGVHVIVVVPNRHDDPGYINASFVRLKIESATYLKNIADQSDSGRFVITNLFAESTHGGSLPVFVHSKVMIVDEEFVLIGTANFGQRSMTFDSEIHLGIIDKNNEFARHLRLELWKEHLQLTDTDLILDPLRGVDFFEAEAGRVRRQSLDPQEGNCCHKKRMNKYGQPYGGPKRRS